MRAPIPLTVAVFFFAIATPLWSDTLWNKATGHFSRQRHLPMNVIIEEKFVSSQGHVEHASTLEATLSRNPDNSILFVPHSGYANGEEIATDELRRMSETLSEKDLRTNLFRPEAGTNWRQEKGMRTIDNRSCQRFSFTSRIDGHQAVGIAWLAADSGLPLEVEWQFTDVPFKQAQTTINSFQQKDTYRIGPGGQCHILSSEISMTLSYTMFFVPYEGQLERRMSFANHQERQNLPLNVVADN